MSDQEITIPGELPNLNAALAGAKRHWSSYAQIKKTQTNKVAWIAKGQLTPITPPINLIFFWVTKTRRVDPDNVSHGAKYIIDGLVNAGILPNDGRKVIRSLTHLFPEPDKKAPRVTVRLIEIKGDDKKSKKGSTTNETDTTMARGQQLRSIQADGRSSNT